MGNEVLHTTCCIVGGGPAGVMLGYLLARAGVQVTVLEKHSDFFRDFRGDTVHPSTLELLWELDLLEPFLKMPHQNVTRLGVQIGGEEFEVADFGRLSTHCRFALMMPQWDFLHFLAEQGRAIPGFDLRLGHEGIGLTEEDGRVCGVRVRTPEGEREIRARLVVASDGRHSMARRAAHLEVEEVGVPIDVLWFRISRREDRPEQVLGYVNYGKMLVLINRNEYYQAGFIIRKGDFEAFKSRGLEAFREGILQVAPFLRESVQELQDWDQVKLLSVQVNRLKRWWRPGLLCIGDAAHAMSPVFGVGINLAIQDAVAAANILAEALKQGVKTDSLLGAVQRRREWRTRLTQFMQVLAHRNFQYIFRSSGPLKLLWLVRLIFQTRLLEPVLLRVIGVGIVPEHVAIAGKTKPRRRAGLARRLGAAAGAIAAAWCLWKRRQRLA